MSTHAFAIVCARRWKDSNGNTYYTSVTRFIIGECVSERIRVPLAYGYGDHYIEDTVATLKEKGHWPVLDGGGTVTVLTSVTDVSKRRQLLAGTNDEL